MFIQHRWSPKEVIEGRHWDVFKMQVHCSKIYTYICLVMFYSPTQGQNKIWYAGASASFESVRSVLSYNNRLLKQMVPHGRSSKSFNGQESQSVFQNRKGTSTAIYVGNCRYSCTSGGGCEVEQRFCLFFKI